MKKYVTQLIANDFNDYFVNIGQNLAKNLIKAVMDFINV